MDDTQQIQISRETITPELAAEMLTRNTRNRTPSKHGIAKLAAAMANGSFSFTGDPIRFNVDNALIDGQHRLAACVESGVSFETLVIRNLPAEVMQDIDGGTPRSVQQQLAVAHGLKALTTNTALMLLRMGMGSYAYSLVPSAVVMEIIHRHPRIAETADAYADAAKFRIGANIPAGELILRANGYQEEADAYRALWTEGIQHPLVQAATTLRERFIVASDSESAAVRRLWSPDFRRKQLVQTLIRIIAGLQAAKVAKTTKGYPAPLFQCATTTALLTTTTFRETVKKRDSQITIESKRISEVKKYTKQARKTDMLEHEQNTLFPPAETAPEPGLMEA